MNIRIINLATSIIFAISFYFTNRDFKEFYNSKSNEVQENNDIIKYIYNMEKRLIIMWFFIMINIRVIIEYMGK